MAELIKMTKKGTETLSADPLSLIFCLIFTEKNSPPSKAKLSGQLDQDPRIIKLDFDRYRWVISRVCHPLS